MVPTLLSACWAIAEGVRAGTALTVREREIAIITSDNILFITLIVKLPKVCVNQSGFYYLDLQNEDFRAGHKMSECYRTS